MRFETIFESITSTETAFGTNEDADNGEVRLIGSNQFTFFKDGENYYAVSVDGDGVFGFASSPGYRPNAREYTTTRLRAANVFRIFGKILYVLRQLVKNSGRPIYYLKFAAADDKLAGLYTRMVNNNRLVREVRSMGFRFVGVMEEKGVERFIFARTY